MSLTLVHCSDLHLGRQRLGGRLPEEDLAAALRYIVQHALIRGADALLIGGDLFDAPTIQPRHLQTAIDCLAPLRDSGIPVFAIEGNHDRPSLSSETTTWVRYLNDMGWLHLLSVPFTQEGPQIRPWDSNLRRWSYVDFKGIRILGAGYLGAGTVRRMRAIAESIGPDTERPPTVVLLHAGPEYLVHEGGGFDRDSLDFMHSSVKCLALGHIHKPMIHQGWAVNPGTPENTRLEEAAYDCRGGEAVPRGMAEIRMDPSTPEPLIGIEILPVPRRPVIRLEYDCSIYENANRDVADRMLEDILHRARSAGASGDAILHLELTGRLNLLKAGLDPGALAGSLEGAIPVLAAEVSLSRLNVEAAPGSAQAAALDGLSRDALERRSIGQLLSEAPIPGLENCNERLVDLIMALKDDVRRGASPEEVLDRLARSPEVGDLAQQQTRLREEGERGAGLIEAAASGGGDRV